jgi:hypothetical protein
MSPAAHVYCGPTISAAEAAGLVPGASVHPPVRHGDLLRLDPDPGLTVVIIDGLFHDVPPVRHKEILHLLAHGAVVAGAASMGALRAAELFPYGMTGVGDIYRAYRDGTLVGDDEVAVAHTPDDYRPLSAAMVDVRAELSQAARDGALGQAEADTIGGRARAIHYAARTWAAIAVAAAPGLEEPMARFCRWRAAANPVPAKLRDARETLRLVAAGKLPRPASAVWPSARWDSCQLHDWLASYHGQIIGGVYVPFRAVLAHQQLYDPAWPGRWRRHVLSWIAARGRRPGGHDVALDTARAAGLDVTNLTPAQAGYWLTPAERAALDVDDQLARILTRAVPQDPAALVWPVTAAQAGELVNPAMDSGHAAAAAAVLSDQISRAGPYRRLCDLRAGPIRAHLADAWRTSPDDAPALTAAARDRGFASADAAVAAARPFFLLAAAGAMPGPAAG